MGTLTALLECQNRDLISIQLMSPASGDYRDKLESIKEILKISIQLMSPASGDKSAHFLRLWALNISIQLMSPASGDYYRYINKNDRPSFPFN